MWAGWLVTVEDNSVYMTRNHRLLLATLCVETVAVGAVVGFGYLSVLAVAVLYWIDLAFVMLRVVGQRLIARSTRGAAMTRHLLPFRRLKHKRGGQRHTMAATGLSKEPASDDVCRAVVVPVPIEGVILLATAPAEFWSHPATRPCFRRRSRSGDKDVAGI